MDKPDPELLAILKALAQSPKRDNAVYLKAMAEARQAFEDAEIALGGPVALKTKTKLKSNGEYRVRWIFTRAG